VLVLEKRQFVKEETECSIEDEYDDEDD